jgi:alpha-glucosidase
MVMDPQELGKPGLGLGRDPERTPMQWDASTNAGFTTGQPWLPVAADYKGFNVDVERDDPHSMLTLVRSLLELRKASPALSVGSYTDVPSDEPDLFSFLREQGDERMLVVLNFSHEPRTFKMNGGGSADVTLSTVPGRSGQVGLANLDIAPDEGLIIRL